MKWKNYNGWGINFYPNDVVELPEEGMEMLQNKINLKSSEMYNHAKDKWDVAVRVLTGKAEYVRNEPTALTPILDEIYNFTNKSVVDAHIACFIINNTDFRGLPNKFLVTWADNEKGQVRLDNLQVVKERKVDEQFQVRWNLFLEILPTITFTFDEMNFYKLGCSFN